MCEKNEKNKFTHYFPQQNPPIKTGPIVIGGVPGGIYIHGDDVFYYNNCITHLLKIVETSDKPEAVDVMSLKAVQSLLKLLQPTNRGTGK